MKAKYPSAICLSLLAVIGLSSNYVVAASASPRKRSQTDQDISAIGNRKIAHGLANRYSLENEKEMGRKLSAYVQQSNAILLDARTDAYLQRLGQTIAQNSDAQIPITVRVIDSGEVYALTLPGGYQYISRGLLLELHNEGELASLISWGIAHTALRSAVSELEKANIMQSASIPMIFADTGAVINSTSAADLSVPLTFLRVRRDDELDADYFAMQYVYKAGMTPHALSVLFGRCGL